MSVHGKGTKIGHLWHSRYVLADTLLRAPIEVGIEVREASAI